MPSMAATCAARSVSILNGQCSPANFPLRNAADGAGVQGVCLLTDDAKQMPADVRRAHIFQSKDDDAWKQVSAGGQQLAKIQVMGQQDSALHVSLFQHPTIRQALKP